MALSKDKIADRLQNWLKAWDEYDLEAVMEWMHEEVVFENWDGLIVNGKNALQKLWTPWFFFNRGFKFICEAIFIDEQTQQVAFQWRYEGFSFEKKYKGLNEIRRGVDILDLLDGKIISKSSYSKTGIQINSAGILLSAE
jgi:hypothetical protein